MSPLTPPEKQRAGHRTGFRLIAGHEFTFPHSPAHLEIGARLALMTEDRLSWGVISNTKWLPEAGSITMLTTSWCGDCVRLKRQLTDLDIPYTEVNIEQTPDAEEFVLAVNNGNRTVPTVVFPDGSTAAEPSGSLVQAKLH
jgi:mycoredoxin